MADAIDPGDAGFCSSKSRYRSSVRQQRIVAVYSALAEMVPNSATITRAFHRPRSAARTLPQPNCSLGTSRLFWFGRWIRSIMSLDLGTIHAAHERIRAYIQCTPVLISSRLDGATPAATRIHYFENEHVMAGQGTAAVELLEQVSDLDLVMCPVGGGGLLAGTAIAAKSMRPKITVIAVEPANADDAAQSFRAGRRLVTEKKFTIADGLRTNVGAPNFAIIQRYVDDIVTVSEEAIVASMRTIWETMKIIVEPSAAVPYAAIRERVIDVNGRRVGIILTGGNVDLDALPWMSSR